MRYSNTIQRLLVAGLSSVIAGCGGDKSAPPPPAPPVQTATLSGSVSGFVNTFIDGDVNDPAAAYIPNNTPAQAQAVPNPLMLSGYLNFPNTGPTGPQFAGGDRSDFYRISLATDQIITVSIADSDTGDLDLFLYYDDGSIDIFNPDFVSEGVNQTEILVAPQSGDYIIEVYAYTGYSNYALVVGQGNIPLNADRLASTDEFVPGEIIVRFKDTALPRGINNTATARAANTGLQTKAGTTDRAMLMTIDTAPRPTTMRAASAPTERIFRSPDPTKQLKLDTLRKIKQLRKRSDVRYAAPNYIQHSAQIPTDEHYKLQWHYPLINLPTAWDITTGSANVIVAVIDTGVLFNHPDLQDQFSSDGGYDFISDDSSSLDNEPGIDANANDPGDSVIGSSSFHGTHVAGTIAAATRFSGNSSGVAGIAPGVKIMPLRVMGKGGSGTDYDILQAVRYAAGLSNDSGLVPAQRADIINLSIGTPARSQAIQNIYTQARNAGVIIVASAGNNSSNAPFYPAAYDGVISVSAIDMNKQLAPYSNFGNTIDVAAPGGDNTQDINGDGYPDGVLSTIGDDSDGNIDYLYKFLQGTSMAAPHATGVIALMKSVYSDLTPANVDNLLASGQIVQDLGTAGRDNQFGHGIIDARKAVESATALAQGSTPDIPVLNVSPASLNFGNSGTSAPLSAVNGGTGVLNIVSVSSDTAWLTVAPADVDASTQLGSYQITVDRSGLAAGVYTGRITMTSSSNTVTIPVIQQVAGQTINNDTGYQYVLLIDADNGDVVDQWQGAPENGEYNFQFSNITFSNEQRFVIYAGTDLNNNGFICDAGEICGAYVSLNQPQSIAADDTHSDLDFTSGFSVGLQSLPAIHNAAGNSPIRRRQTKNIR